MKRHLLLGLLALLTISACRETGPEGEFFRITGKLVVFNYRVADATFVLTLTPTQPVREGQTVVATFENPAGGDPIVSRRPVWPRLAHQTVESPPLACIVRDRPYAVTIAIEDAQGRRLQFLETTITSTEDQQLMPDRPLVVGPVYTPNPELTGHPGGKLEDQPASCPAK